MKLDKLYKKIDDLYYKKIRVVEDVYVLDFLNRFDTPVKLAEMGSGIGRFAKKIVQNKMFDLICYDINSDLVEQTKRDGLKSIQTSLPETDIASNEYDIIHCSHVIEHFGYPDIINVLDEFCRVVKIGGYIIIRTPLISSKFYNDIDHIRPYPPQSIISYFNNIQQQKQSKYKISVVGVKLRRQSYIPLPYSFSRFAKLLNHICMLLWIWFRFPRSKPNAYTLIIRKDEL